MEGSRLNMTNNTFKKHFEKVFFEGKRIPTGLYAYVLVVFVTSVTLLVIRKLLNIRRIK